MSRRDGHVALVDLTITIHEVHPKMRRTTTVRAQVGEGAQGLVLLALALVGLLALGLPMPFLSAIRAPSDALELCDVLLSAVGS